MSQIHILENWSLNMNEDNPYLAPELRAIRLSGECESRAKEITKTGHISHITTSRIINYNEETKIASTKSGTQYKLGQPNPDYVKWCSDNGYSSPENGLKQVTK